MKSFLKRSALVLIILGALCAIPLGLAIVLVYPRLPDLSALAAYHPKLPLRIYTEDGALIGEYGEQRRALVHIDQVPLLMKEAILAAEDDRFYQHGAVDFLGVARAAAVDILSGGKREGGSTITMQVARNFFLSSKKTFTRKLSEVLLSWKIEHELTKDQILELYINQIYLGQRAYGFEAAAETYFGKRLDQLNIAEMAMLAGLPKGPSKFNPVADPQRAAARQQYVLRRMDALKFITDDQYRQALNTQLHVKRSQSFDVPAEYVAEMVRQAMYDKYGESIYTSGMKVYTTLRRADQIAARQALTDGVLAYDRRHGWRGPEAALDPGFDLSPAALEAKLSGYDPVQGLLPALVLDTGPGRVRLYVQRTGEVDVSGDGLALVRRALSPAARTQLRPGDVVRAVQGAQGWAIAQLPQVEATLVSIDPANGAIRALVGGFDYGENQFNHATQAWRQPGSSFKPFIYSAAIDKGYTPSSIFVDAPVDLPDGKGGIWSPQNDDNQNLGPITLREALAKSDNVVAVKLLQAIGTQYASDYLTRFGFSPDKNPPYLTLALGVGSVTPMQMANAYAVLANGGYRVTPYFVERVEDADGNVLASASPDVAGRNAQRVIDPRNDYLIRSMLQSVTRFGTGADVAKMGRSDLAGKTGTTSDGKDAWFCGFNQKLVTITWIGYDRPRSLGSSEYGATAALPIWMEYMGRALQGVPDVNPPMPPGVVLDTYDPATGARAPGGSGPTDLFYATPPASPPAVGGDAAAAPAPAPPAAPAPVNGPFMNQFMPGDTSPQPPAGGDHTAAPPEQTLPPVVPAPPEQTLPPVVPAPPDNH